MEIETTSNPATEEDENPRTVFVGNIPAETSKWDIESIFGGIGPLKRCYIQYPKNFNRTQSDTTVAYVTYALPEDASSAIEKLGSHTIGKNKLCVKLSKARSIELQDRKRPKFPRFGASANLEPIGETLKKPKQPRQKTVSKKPRLIVRNLSFQMTDEKLREHFGEYGDIKDVNILKKPNGKLVGCAFIQFAKVSQASKALRDLNLKPLLGRPIAVDWALPKTKFQNQKDEENPEDDDEKPKIENLDIKIKEEPPCSDDENVKSEVKVKVNKKKRKRNDSSSSESDTEVKISDSETPETKPKVRKLNPNDADEGKTLFIRNLNFDTTSEKLKQFFFEFGPINYAVICIDRLTEHSKGTAFVMFRNAEDLQKSLTKYEEDPGHFILDDRQFFMAVAMSKSKLSEKLTSDIKKEPKDKRNLYLVREGFIRPGTTAATDISAADVNLRATLHHHKRQMLKDLNNFISDKRICVHNLPEKYSDKQLRSLFLKSGGPGATVTEARIMQDRNVMTSEGFKSKSFGFVTFTEHEHALTALRALNNNPQIFTRTRRPVVEFSVEKKAALIAKEKRTEKSKQKIKQIQQEKEETEGSNVKKGKRKGTKNPKPVVKKSKGGDNMEVPEFGGLAGMVGISSIPSMKPKGKITRKSLKASKPKTRKLLPRRKRDPKSQSRRGKGEDDHFDKTLSAYKSKNNYSEKSDKNLVKKKWFKS